MNLESMIEVASGRTPADRVLRGGQIVNVYTGEVYPADVALCGEHIAGIGSYEGKEVVELDGRYICPGLIDAHVHIESSMLAVPEFARLVSTCGTTAVVTDPHEIANVMGTEGIRYMLSSSKYCPIHIYVMASSCVPASHFESAGAELSALDLQPLMGDRWVLGLAEMMNYPGVVNGDPECLAKLEMMRGQPIDGHAPGLSGHALCAYTATGIGSDHECTTADEAREKLRLGLAIMIREGSQARNLEALLPVITPESVGQFMFCTDDKDVDDLLEQGQIDHMLRMAVRLGLDPVQAVRIATLNTARYFRLHDLGAVAPGKRASLAIFDDLKDFKAHQVYCNGQLVAEGGQSLVDAHDSKPAILRSTINVKWLEPEQFAVPAPSTQPCDVHVIEVLEDRIDTERAIESITPQDGMLRADPTRDLAKIAVIERHRAEGNIGHAFVRGFGFQRGAIASSVGHDSHNLVVVGTNDTDLYTAAVHLVKIRGGFCVVRDGEVLADVPLPIAGLMSTVDADALSDQLRTVHAAAAELDGNLRRPFMALSFLSLSVIGKLKVTDQGLIDVERFERIPLFVE